eukprot:Blabericola_migrator_1__2341@NODE_1652_length_4084_cov_93_725417_g1075_i0_p2_GENE_NODE_1652_length_4084_cov_93_725417_g1075_i0NODE_1652_length_4084_cov_93_725417_g1075_i0_p2_ORF_typecomplete_len411_score65_80RST/PF12174_8/8e03RST/PF12174_8/0_088RST/PF12174_8/3_5e03_NODE_1652_length_4084_cov_93_725417_g1075_i031235
MLPDPNVVPPLVEPVKSKKLANWLVRNLPFDEQVQDHTLSPAHKLRYGKRDVTLGRLTGTGVNTTLFSYWRELFDRDERVFLKCLLRQLGLAYNPKNDVRIPAARLSEALRTMGIPARSNLMTYICDTIEWFEDNTVSLRRLQEVAGDLEELRTPESVLDPYVNGTRDSVADLLYPADGRPLNKSKVGFPSPATSRLITNLYEQYDCNRISAKEFCSMVRRLTGVQNPGRLTALLDENHDDRMRYKKKLTLQKVLCAIFRDMEDELNDEPPAALAMPRPRRCSRTPTSSSDAFSSSDTRTDDLGCLPSETTRIRLRKTIVEQEDFPRYPTDADMKFLREIAEAFATGWLSQYHFKSLLDTWKLELSPSMARCIRDHAVRKRCSLRALYASLLNALEATGVHVKAENTSNY